MYLNVNLTTPPPAAGEGSCTTPKTPEILNSLINLTSPPLPNSYSQYQNQVVSGTLLSPISDISSPGEESPMTLLTSTCHSRAYPRTRHMSEPLDTARGVAGGGGGGGGLVGGSPGTSGVGGPLAGASPPSTPDLPSPVNTVEATKSALIKEGLKLQIRSKLQAVGGTSDSLLNEFSEIKREENELTEEDEERRRRRRERNKVAATKCRNKKKEKTICLVSESESVEDVNIRLKNEIQRLTTEKQKLEKLLRDPNHRASCCHTPRCAKALRPPLVIVTPAESPDTTSSSSSPSSTTSSTSSLGSPTSPPLPNSITYNFPPPPPATPTSPLSQPHVSLSTSLTTLPNSSSSSVITSCAHPSSSSSSASLSPSSQFLAPKYSATQNSSQRHHPYQIPLGRSHQSPNIEGEKQQFGSPNSSSSCHLKPGFNYTCLGAAPRTHEFIPPNPPSQKSVYTTPKPRSTNLARYNPYAGRPHPVPSPLSTHTHPQPGTLTCGDTYIQSNNNSGCGREDQQSYVTDVHTNQFFPPCSYSSM